MEGLPDGRMGLRSRNLRTYHPPGKMSSRTARRATFGQIPCPSGANLIRVNALMTGPTRMNAPLVVAGMTP